MKKNDQHVKDFGDKHWNNIAYIYNIWNDDSMILF